MEYGGWDHLDFAARNDVENVRRQETGVAGLTYERALWNLVVAMSVTTWTSSGVIPPWWATGWYLHTIVWKWPPNWVITTRPSGGYDPSRSCPTGSPHWRFQPETSDSTMWMLTPCWGTPCTPPSAIQKRLLEPTTMSTMRAKRWGDYR